jgi:hypothetical protein
VERKEEEMSITEAAEPTGLRLIEGGLAATAPKEPNDQGNWLAGLDKGTIFLYRKRASHPGHQLSAFQIVFQFEKAALLGRNSESAPDYLEYVDTKMFSNLHELFEVIYILPKQQEQIVGEEHDGDRSD